MQSIQQIAREAFAVNPGFTTKVLAEAEKIAADMNTTADDGEAYEVRPFANSRFVVAMLFNGEFEMFL